MDWGTNYSWEDFSLGTRKRRSPDYFVKFCKKQKNLQNNTFWSFYVFSSFLSDYLRVHCSKLLNLRREIDDDQTVEIIVLSNIKVFRIKNSKGHIAPDIHLQSSYSFKLRPFYWVP